MTVAIVGENLGPDGLKLELVNDLGQLQDAFSVRWSVMSSDGSVVSGSVPAARSGVGRYFAQWRPSVPQGTYSVRWSVQDLPGSAVRDVVQNFAVLDRGNYPARGAADLARGVTAAVGVYVTGSVLGPGELPLFLRDSSGFLTDAYSVFWTVLGQGGREVMARSAAVRAAAGEYYAPWSVSPVTGDYVVRWDWAEASDAPLQSRDFQAAVVCPFALPVPALVSYGPPPAPGVSYPRGSCPSSPCPSSCPPAPMSAGSFPIEVRASLSESGGSSDFVVVSHAFGRAPSVYVLKRVADTWVDAVGTVDVVHDSGFTTVTVVNATDLALDVLIRISGA